MDCRVFLCSESSRPAWDHSFHSWNLNCSQVPLNISQCSPLSGTTKWLNVIIISSCCVYMLHGLFISCCPAGKQQQILSCTCHEAPCQPSLPLTLSCLPPPLLVFLLTLTVIYCISKRGSRVESELIPQVWLNGWKRVADDSTQRKGGGLRGESVVVVVVVVGMGRRESVGRKWRGGGKRGEYKSLAVRN